MNAREVKKLLQYKYDQGGFDTRQSLIDFGECRGWIVRRNSLNFLTFENESWEGSRKRVRVKVDFGDNDTFAKFKEREKIARILATPYRKKAYFTKEPHSLSGYDIRWVYVIFAKFETEFSAYVGHTSRVSPRLKGHLRSKSTRRSSGPLQAWAGNHGVELQFAIVDVIHGNMGKSAATSKATHLEGFWTERARKNGVNLPGVEGWGQFPVQPKDLNFHSGWEKVLATAKPVHRIISKEYNFDQVCLDDIDISKIQEKFVKRWEEIYSTRPPIGEESTNSF